ncbi:TetR family transcriptional regulator [Alicycliphilus denitrificans]|uniref:TetR family transcriptional regulator n=1 Tax=Alicycliphilus denitrificans TaxID=179636 RepID=UPI00384A9BE1
MARRTKEDADTTRNNLLDAAERVFYEKGVARASLGEIAQAAGATRGAIYWHFKDKVALFNAMMDRVSLPLEEACGEGGVSDRSAPLARLLAMVERVILIVMSDERTRRVCEIAFYRVEYVDELMAARERHLASRARFHALLARDLCLAADERELSLPMDAAVAATGLQALFDGLLHAWILGGERFDLLVVGRATVTAYLRGLGFDA